MEHDVPDVRRCCKCIAASSGGRQTLLKRMFSTESKATSRFSYTLYPSPNFTYSLCGKEFLLKIAQVLVSIVCAGLYSTAVTVITHKNDYSISSQMFPNVAYSSYIIISSIIALGYALGQVMPELLQRAFNAIGAILFFVATGVIGHAWYKYGRFEHQEEEFRQPADMLLALIITTAINFVLYVVDVGISIRKSLTGHA